MQSNFQIKFITPAECIDLRSRILRPGQNIEFCHFPEDQLTTTFHLGLIIDQKIVSTGTFMLNSNPQFSQAKHPYRLRGMATEHSFQGKNLGSALLQRAEAILKSQNCDFLWFNAREKAFSFYQKNNYIFYGEMFDIHLVGPHKVMYKWL